MPNKIGLTKFIQNVWPKFENAEIKLAIYGRICYDGLLGFNSRNIVCRGFIENINSIYSEIDVAINPVYFGAGVKINSLEALANGIPLISTSHGARGINFKNKRILMLADSDELFSKALFSLIKGYECRKILADNAYKYMADNFSTEKCYGALSNVLQLRIK